jgi:DNA polymerase I
MTDTLRSCIIAEQGYTFLSLDASQIELRVIAILSQDQQMLADLATGDLHLATAIRISEMNGIAVDSWINDPVVKKKKRYDAKQCNFAVIYGAQEFQLATMMECSEDEALEFMREHREAYPRLYQWMEEQVELARENGYVMNPLGRIRPIPDLHSTNWKIREGAEKEVVNTLVQGYAVDIVKMAMITLRKLFGDSIRLVLQVHDEMLWEIPDELLAEALETSKELSGYFPQYPFKPAVGKVYGEMEEVKA